MQRPLYRDTGLPQPGTALKRAPQSSSKRLLDLIMSDLRWVYEQGMLQLQPSGLVGKVEEDSEEVEARNLIPEQKACLIQWCVDPDLGQAQRWGDPVTRDQG